MGKRKRNYQRKKYVEWGKEGDTEAGQGRGRGRCLASETSGPEGAAAAERGVREGVPVSPPVHRSLQEGVRRPPPPPPPGEITGAVVPGVRGELCVATSYVESRNVCRALSNVGQRVVSARSCVARWVMCNPGFGGITGCLGPKGEGFIYAPVATVGRERAGQPPAPERRPVKGGKGGHRQTSREGCRGRAIKRNACIAEGNGPAVRAMSTKRRRG